MRGTASVNIGHDGASNCGMNRLRKHQLPKRRIADRLRAMGFRVTNVATSEGYDLLVDGRLRVALRVAFPRQRLHRVTVRERKYTYRYRSWHFNFHHHGRLDEPYADVIVCLAMEPRHPEKEAVFVIPWESVTGKTFSLHASRRDYGGKYARYRDRWDVVTERLGGVPEGLPKVA